MVWVHRWTAAGQDERLRVHPKTYHIAQQNTVGRVTKATGKLENNSNEKDKNEKKATLLLQIMIKSQLSS